MPWNKSDYPVSMKNLDARIRNKAIDIANALLDEGYEEGRAIAIATAQAEKWNEDHPAGHDRSGLPHDSDHRDSKSGPSGSSSHGNLHIVSADEGWALKEEGRDKPLSTFDTKKEALHEAKKTASEFGVNTIIHGEDGRIQTTKSS
ncbi:DUF2188 domain-containing protein [Paenibacillus sp. HJL G12]|uniref:DUF2188 domain-containing protein n=1 Tax=Paenibacillus dendrobii TaxID=2691084 RepID=A0A7X3IJG2_9BACL|nr:DUF2188 domain-containing protein [Paenibacillus dendrobii]MWV45102.1 DUF2188 domain-containing protein [Paenibacillus dendrobii]